MIKVIIFIIVFALAIIFGKELSNSQGFVQIATENYIVASSLSTTVILICALFIIFYFAIRFIVKFIALPKGTARFFSNISAKKAIALQNDATIAYYQGEYERVLSLLKKSNSDIKNLPFASKFIMADCAFKLNNYELTRQILSSMLKDDNTKIASIIFRAKLNIKVGNTKAAREELDAIKNNCKFSSISKLLLQCYQKEHDFEQIIKLIPTLKRLKIISNDQLLQLFNSNINYLLQKAQSSDEVEQVHNLIPRKDRQEPAVLGPIINKYVHLGDLNRAKRLCLHYINNTIDPEILESISCFEISMPEVLSALRKIENDNVIASKVNAPLLKAIANLEFNAGNLDEAKKYYLKAYELVKSDSIALSLAKIYTQTRQYDLANDYFSKILSKNTNILQLKEI